MVKLVSKASGLKKLKLIDYDLRKALTPAQNKRINRLYKEYKQIILKPETFHFATVKKESAKVLKKSGYTVIGTRAIIPHKGFDKVSIKKDHILSQNSDLKEITLLSGSPKFHANLKSLANKKLNRNQYMSAKIGDNAAFDRPFLSYADLFRYVNTFNPKDAENDSKKAFNIKSMISVTTYTAKKPLTQTPVLSAKQLRAKQVKNKRGK